MEECGFSSVQHDERIVGGEPSQIHAWPWIAVLGYLVIRLSIRFWKEFFFLENVKWKQKLNCNTTTMKISFWMKFFPEFCKSRNRLLVRRNFDFQSTRHHCSTLRLEEWFVHCKFFKYLSHLRLLLLIVQQFFLHYLQTSYRCTKGGGRLSVVGGRDLVRCLKQLPTEIQ